MLWGLWFRLMYKFTLVLSFRLLLSKVRGRCPLGSLQVCFLFRCAGEPVILPAVAGLVLDGVAAGAGCWLGPRLLGAELLPHLFAGQCVCDNQRVCRVGLLGANESGLHLGQRSRGSEAVLRATRHLDPVPPRILGLVARRGHGHSLIAVRDRLTQPCERAAVVAPVRVVLAPAGKADRRGQEQAKCDSHWSPR